PSPTSRRSPCASGNPVASEAAGGPSARLVVRVALADPRPSLSSRRSLDGTGRRGLPRISTMHLLRRHLVLVDRVTTNIDPPAGQPGRQPRVPPFLTDRHRQLEIGHDSS